jgi:exopolysaccharide production protein ExoZ
MAQDSTAENPILALKGMPPPAKIDQIDGLQILRAVAVFLVAWLHGGQSLDGWRVTELPHFGAFGIDIFFVISGFIMSSVILRTRSAPGGAWAFLKRRLIRIFPIYWVFAMLLSIRLIHGHGFFSQNYFPSFLLLPGLYPRYPLILGFSWTMIFEMFFYYMLAAILLVTVKWAVPLSIALFGAMVLLGKTAGVSNPTWITFTSPILLEFVFGSIVAIFFIRFGQRRRLGIAMLLFGVAVSLYMRAHPQQGGAAGIDMVLSSAGAIRRVLTWGIGAVLIVSGVVFWSPTTQNLPAKVAVALGNASYSAYLASQILIEFGARFIMKFGGRSNLEKEALLQLLLVVTVFVGGWFSYLFVERPMILWLNAKARESKLSSPRFVPRIPVPPVTD